MPLSKAAVQERERLLAFIRLEGASNDNRHFDPKRLPRWYKTRRHEIAGDLANAKRVREHLANLSAHGVGRHAVADASDVPQAVLADIKIGRKYLVTSEIAEKILAVTVEAIADGALVPAAPTYEAIDHLKHRGLTDGNIRRLLGSTATTPTLALGKDFVLARTAFKIAKLAKLPLLRDKLTTLQDDGPKFCECIKPIEAGERCGKCQGYLRPIGMTHALLGGQDSTKPIQRAFGRDKTGHGLEVKRSKEEIVSEERELRALAKLDLATPAQKQARKERSRVEKAKAKVFQALRDGVGTIADISARSGVQPKKVRRALWCLWAQKKARHEGDIWSGS